MDVRRYSVPHCDKGSRDIQASCVGAAILKVISWIAGTTKVQSIGSRMIFKCPEPLGGLNELQASKHSKQQVV